MGGDIRGGGVHTHHGPQQILPLSLHPLLGMNVIMSNILYELHCALNSMSLTLLIANITSNLSPYGALCFLHCYFSERDKIAKLTLLKITDDI